MTVTGRGSRVTPCASGYKVPSRDRVEADEHDRFELSSNAEAWVTIVVGYRPGNLHSPNSPRHVCAEVDGS
jgi:hypothetical protein